jgi:hypothetical protein
LRRVTIALFAVAAVGAATAPAAIGGAPTFGSPVKLAGLKSGFTEPRLARGPDGTSWAITNDPDTGDAIVLSSTDGGSTWRRTPTEFPGQQQATPDTDIAVTRTGRVIATELDGAGVSFVTAYTDDRGRTWTAVQGTSIADTDRPWFAVGPDDPTSHQPRVYLFWHNLVSGVAQHLMNVQTSTDGGATFGAPVPVALPGSQAYLDLQCADSGAPSSLTVDPRSGRIYAVFGTRTSALGGCGASVTGQPEANVVGETRIWVASSPDGSVGSWTDSLAADGGDRVVSASFETSALDAAGNVYVAYAQTARPYPDFSQADVRYVVSAAGGAQWSKPVVVAPGGPIGHYDPTIAAGDRGRLAIAYYEGASDGGLRAGSPPVWSVRDAVVRGADTGRPAITYGVVDPRPAYAQTADAMGGACSSGPLAGLENGFLCDRATDDWAVGLDAHCRLMVLYPMSVNSAPGAAPGTWVAVQRGEPTLCATAAAPARVVSPPHRPTVPTDRRLPATGPPAAASALAALVLLFGLALRRAGTERVEGRGPRLRQPRSARGQHSSSPEVMASAGREPYGRGIQPWGRHERPVPLHRIRTCHQRRGPGTDRKPAGTAVHAKRRRRRLPGRGGQQPPRSGEPRPHRGVPRGHRRHRRDRIHDARNGGQ